MFVLFDISEDSILLISEKIPDQRPQRRPYRSPEKRQTYKFCKIHISRPSRQRDKRSCSRKESCEKHSATIMFIEYLIETIKFLDIKKEIFAIFFDKLSDLVLGKIFTDKEIG
jgi:hypothetical protein